MAAQDLDPPGEADRSKRIRYGIGIEGLADDPGSREASLDVIRTETDRLVSSMPARASDSAAPCRRGPDPTPSRATSTMLSISRAVSSGSPWPTARAKAWARA